jgi:hypothetical protein
MSYVNLPLVIFSIDSFSFDRCNKPAVSAGKAQRQRQQQRRKTIKKAYTGGSAACISFFRFK